MIRSAKTITALACLFLSANLVFAAQAEKPGSIKGRVVDANKSPVAKFVVKLLKPRARDAGGGQGGRGKSTDLPNNLQDTGMLGGKVVKSAATDANGEFKFAGIAPGTYHLDGGNMNVGMFLEQVVVESEKETDMGELTPQK